jgi:L-threonylcarbamoyladenylate synthase
MSAQTITRVSAPDDGAIAIAVRLLAEGYLVAFPTETVYGLGADAQNSRAVARLYDAKGRPSFNPLIAHVADVAAAQRLAAFNTAAERLAQEFWPGPLTLVLPKRTDCRIAELATAGLDSIAVRVPSHPVAQRILRGTARPIVAPSANRSGHVSPTSAAHVLSDLRGRIELILDGGPTPMGLESTIIACLDEPALLRPGALTRAQIEHALSRTIPFPNGEGGAALGKGPCAEEEALLAPGQMGSHYAPRAQIRLEARDVRSNEALLAFGSARIEGADVAVMSLNLSSRADLIEAAANFFSHLRALDASGATTIAVMPVPQNGLGEAINDRLARAAGPRAARGNSEGPPSGEI